MEKIAIFLVLGFIASSCGKNHQITGEIDGLGNDTLLVQYAPVAQFYEMDEFLVDTILATGDKFSVDFPAKEPVLAFIFPKKAEFKRLDGSLYYPEYKYLILLIEPDDQIRVRGTFHEYYLAYEAKGSDFNRDYSQLREGY